MLYRMKRGTVRPIDQAADALLLNPRTAAVVTRMRALFSLSARIAPIRCSSGVKKFRSLEEAAEDRLPERWCRLEE
ncbi:MAG: hypothetical protein ACYC9Y_10495 [Candidatus Methylomirabilia bacterium]